VLRLAAERADLIVRWVVFSGSGGREAEARSSAAAFLQGDARHRIDVLQYRDGYFPFAGADIKDAFEGIRRDFDPSLILTHWRGDAHQDHQLIANLTHQTFRDHLILGFEIPKYDSDLGNPNLFVPLTQNQMQQKIRLILDQFKSQRSRTWFTDQTFLAVARLRGIACNASEGVAEGFHVGKVVF